MGRRGPKPTPTTVLKLRGSWWAKNRPQDDKLDQKRPACPKRFITKRKTGDGESIRKVAKSTWDRLAPQLHAAGLLVDGYREPFECLCDSYARYVLACSKCDDLAMVDVTDKGNNVQSPWIAIRNKMWEQVYKGAACFGLTPADISGVRAMEKPTVEDAKQRFFGGAG